MLTGIFCLTGAGVMDNEELSHNVANLKEYTLL